MCRFICRIADTQFRNRVQELTRSKDELIRTARLATQRYCAESREASGFVEFWY